MLNVTYIYFGQQKDEYFRKAMDEYVKRIGKYAKFTEKVLKPEKLSKAAEAIINADRVAIYGLGNSSSVAQDMQHKLMRAGINAVAYSDNHMQAISASHLGEKDVAVTMYGVYSVVRPSTPILMPWRSRIIQGRVPGIS